MRVRYIIEFTCAVSSKGVVDNSEILLGSIQDFRDQMCNKGCGSKLHMMVDDGPTVPKPRARRRTRAELDAARKAEAAGTTVVATPVSMDALRAVGRLSNTTAGDELAPEAGADPGPVPAHLARRA